MATTTKPRSKSYNCEENMNDEEVTKNAEEFHVMRLEPRPFRPFKTSEEYLYAMKEDLAEWLKTLYSIDITVDNFFEQLETGVILCHHANSIVKVAREFKSKEQVFEVDIPDREVVFRHEVLPGTFPARDNVSNFISWCRSLAVKECLLFETEDLVTRKNERSVILCLLEVARVGARFGMLAPILVQIEQEIDAEIENPVPEDGTGTNDYMSMSTVAFQTHEQRMAQLMGLHERVVNLLNRCTCPSQFPMIKVADGKYRIGDRLIIFVRILRNHVMVRVGGGWDTLEHYLDKHDPCRCRSGHRFSTSAKLTMSSDKTGSPHMQVTYNRPAAVSDPPAPSPGLISQYIMENTMEKECSSYPAKNHTPPLSIYSSLPKSRSRSFDTAAVDSVDEVRQPSAPKRYSCSPKGTKKENSDPSTLISTVPNQAPLRRQSVESSTPVPDHKLPLVPSCPNRIPLQKSASKSKIPCLEPSVQNGHKISSKSQSTEDLYVGKYCNGGDDRWQQRSRSSNSSPVHGTPRSTSMEQCSLVAIASRPVYSRRSEDFSYTRPGQYSFRHSRQSPELRRKSDQGTKTWAHNTRIQRPALHSEWVSPSSPSNTRIPSPRLQHVAPSARVSSSKSKPIRSSNDEEYDTSQAWLKNAEMCIDQYRSRVEGHAREENSEGVNGYRSSSPTIQDGRVSRSRQVKEGIAGSVSRIPVPQRNK